MESRPKFADRVSTVFYSVFFVMFYSKCFKCPSSEWKVTVNRTFGDELCPITFMDVSLREILWSKIIVKKKAHIDNGVIFIQRIGLNCWVSNSCTCELYNQSRHVSLLVTFAVKLTFSGLTAEKKEDQ